MGMMAAAGATLAVLCLAVRTKSSFSPPDLYENAWKDVRGVNYVPSYSSNPIETWNSYQPSVIERELGYASNSLGMNTVRTFTSLFVWQANRTAFLRAYDHFLGACAAHGIRPLMVLLDDDFYDPPGVATSADITGYLANGTWRGAQWMANPGIPVATADAANGFALTKQYLADLTGGARANDTRVLGYDMCNEPHRAYPAIPGGLAAYVTMALETVNSLTLQPTTVDAYAGAPHNVSQIAGGLSFHSYYAYGHHELCKAQAAEVCHSQYAAAASQLPAATALRKPLLVSEMGQFDCYCPAAQGFMAAGVGWIAWELMMEHDQFRAFQGILYKNGTARDPAEAACLQRLATSPVKQCPTAPPGPNSPLTCNRPGCIYVDDNDTAVFEYSSGWTAWHGAGPINGSLHFSNAHGANATACMSAIFGSSSVAQMVSAIRVVHKTGPDCGVLSISLLLDGKATNASETIAAVEVDTYAHTVEWNHVTRLILSRSLPASAQLQLRLSNTGERNAQASNSFVQIVGVMADISLAKNELEGLEQI